MVSWQHTFNVNFIFYGQLGHVLRWSLLLTGRKATMIIVIVDFETLFVFRLFLAGMHFNENANRGVKNDAAGNPKISVQFPKAKKGEYSIKILKQESTYGKYFPELAEKVHFLSESRLG